MNPSAVPQNVRIISYDSGAASTPPVVGQPTSSDQVINTDTFRINPGEVVAVGFTNWAGSLPLSSYCCRVPRTLTLEICESTGWLVGHCTYSNNIGSGFTSLPIAGGRAF